VSSVTRRICGPSGFAVCLAVLLPLLLLSACASGHYSPSAAPPQRTFRAPQGDVFLDLDALERSIADAVKGARVQHGLKGYQAESCENVR
jgi:hypothetical protein